MKTDSSPVASRTARNNGSKSPWLTWLVSAAVTHAVDAVVSVRACGAGPGCRRVYLCDWAPQPWPEPRGRGRLPVGPSRTQSSRLDEPGGIAAALGEIVNPPFIRVPPDTVHVNWQPGGLHTSEPKVDKLFTPDRLTKWSTTRRDQVPGRPGSGRGDVTVSGFKLNLEFTRSALAARGGPGRLNRFDQPVFDQEGFSNSLNDL